jgi:inorganic pyrophosphatase
MRRGRMTRPCCVPLRDPASSHLLELDDLRPSLLAETEHFFAVYKDLEDKKAETQGFQDLGAALVTLGEARQRAAETAHP